MARIRQTTKLRSQRCTLAGLGVAGGTLTHTSSGALVQANHLMAGTAERQVNALSAAFTSQRSAVAGASERTVRAISAAIAAQVARIVGAVLVPPVLGTPSMTSGGATITFSGGSGYTTLIPQYRLVGAGSWTSLSNDTSSPLTYTGLAAGNYAFRALANGLTTYASNIVNGSVVTDDYPYPVPLTSDKYYDPSAGADGSGTEASPYNTLTLARVRAITNGQVLFCRAGTTTLSFEWADLGNGAAEARRAIAAYPGETHVFDFPDGGTSITGRFGGTKYWDFYGIKFDCYETGFILGSNDEVYGNITHLRFIDCIGIKTANGVAGNAWVDNTAIIRAGDGGSSCDYISVIRGSYTGPGSAGFSNNSLLWFDRTRHVYILGVLLDNCENLVYYKHNHNQTTSGAVEIIIRNCVLSRGNIRTDCAWIQWLNNLHLNCGLNLTEAGGSSSSPGGRDGTVKGCTFWNSSVYIDSTDMGPGYDNIVGDNVFAGTSRLYDGPYDAIDRRTVSSHNAYQNIGTIYTRNSTNFTSLPSVKTTYPDREINSVQGAIVFVGGASPTINYATLAADVGQWALAGGSPGKGAASAANDCGVDHTKLLMAA